MPCPRPAIAVLIVLLFNLGCCSFNETTRAWRAARAVLCCCCRRRRSQGLLLASHRRRGAPRDAAPASYWAWDVVDPRDAYHAAAWGGAGQSGGSPDAGGSLALATFRALQAAVFVFATAYEHTANHDGARGYFIFFTNWTFVLFGLVSVMGTGLTFEAWRSGRIQRYRRGGNGSSSDGGGAPVTGGGVGTLVRRPSQSASGRLPRLLEASPWHAAAGVPGIGPTGGLPLSSCARLPASSDGGGFRGTAALVTGTAEASRAAAAEAAGAAGDAAGECRVLDKAYVLLLQTVAATSVTLTLFYWALLYTKGQAVRVGECMEQASWGAGGPLFRRLDK
jgi:hypothetical protein